MIETIKITKAVMEEMQQIEAISLLNKIDQKFLDNSKKGNFLWEELSDYNWSLNSEAWRWIADFVGNSGVIMFFFENGKPKAFRFLNGKSVVEVFGETRGFDMYITNKEIDYFLAYSHHDVLYACGNAKEWLEKYDTASNHH